MESKRNKVTQSPVADTVLDVVPDDILYELMSMLDLLSLQRFIRTQKRFGSFSRSDKFKQVILKPKLPPFKRLDRASDVQIHIEENEYDSCCMEVFGCFNEPEDFSDFYVTITCDFESSGKHANKYIYPEKYEKALEEEAKQRGVDAEDVAAHYSYADFVENQVFDIGIVQVGGALNRHNVNRPYSIEDTEKLRSVVLAASEEFQSRHFKVTNSLPNLMYQFTLYQGKIKGVYGGPSVALFIEDEKTLFSTLAKADLLPLVNKD